MPGLLLPFAASNIQSKNTRIKVHGAINGFAVSARLECKVFQVITSKVCGDPAVYRHPSSN